MRARRREPGTGTAAPLPAMDAGARAADTGTPAGPVPDGHAPVSALGPQELLALQRTAGNAAASRLLDRRTRPTVGALAPVIEENDDPDAIQQIDAEGRPVPDRRPGARRPRIRTRPAPRRRGELFDEQAPERPEHPPLVLPPYLLDLTSAGLSTAFDLRGHEFVGHAIERATGGSGDDITAIRQELSGRPETFYGSGRAFSVRGDGGFHDVTVAIVRDSEREPAPTLFANPAAPEAVVPASGDLEDPATKVDNQHSSSGAVTTEATRSRQLGLSGSGTMLLPAAPGVWAGAQFAAGGALTSGQDAHTARTVAEPRTLRSSGGSVRAPRQVKYTVRVGRPGTGRPPLTFTGTGGLTMRVPREHLVPLGTTAPAHAPGLLPEQARDLRLATSVAALAVADAGAPHEGGGGLFDAVASVLHPSVIAPGSPGRARLFAATASATVLQDLSRYLAGWVPGEDLESKDGSAASAYRMRADILSMAPAWGAGQTQLRTHQQTQHGAGTTTSKGSSVTGGAGPAVGLGAPPGGPALRLQGIATGTLKRARFAAADRSVATRQGAEVRGDKVLYRGRVQLTVQGSGPVSPEAAVAGRRTAGHTLDAWVTLRAEEARHLGLPLPPGVETDDDLYTTPTETGPDGTPRPVERRLPFDAMGSSTALTHLDTRPLIDALETLFAGNPRLTGYLPAFEETPRAADGSREEAEQQRRNYRELVTVLSETNLRANKDQLLSGGIPVRLRRKTMLHSHDVQIRVKGSIGEIRYLGDTADWLVRSSAGVGSSGQSGRAGSRQAGVRGNAQVTLVPRALSVGVTADAALEGGRLDQGGPTTRTDSLNSGATETSTFGTRLRFAVDVRMTSRDRSALRLLTPGSPGRDEPASETIASTDADAAADRLSFEAQEQDVRLSTPTALTVDAGTRRTLARRARGGHRAHPLASAGIGALTGGAGGRDGLREWDFVETVGDGRDIQGLAFELLGLAARRGRTDKVPDTAYEAEGLAPRLAVEDRFGPQAVTAALRQGVNSGWVVDGLRHARRLADLEGAVGTRFALTAPRVVLKSTGTGTENMAQGGHQASGRRTRTKSAGLTYNAAGSEHGERWSLGQSLSYHRGVSTTDTETTALAGTVERNAVNPRTEPLFLVQCNLNVRMAAEVKVGGRRPYVAAGQRTLLGAAAVWLTAAQLRAAGLEDPEERTAREAELARGETGAAGERADGTGGAGAPAAGAPGAGERVADERAVDERATGERAADERAADERATGGRVADERATGGQDSAEHAAGRARDAVREPAGQRKTGGREPGQAPETDEQQTSRSQDTGEQETRRAHEADQAQEGAGAQALPGLPELSGVPGLAAGQPLGLGLIEDMPDLVPLLDRLRADVADRQLARDLLPKTRLDDPFDNVQRLLRILDRDGATGLLAGAMDGGVTVELLRNSGTPGRRAKPYWAVLRLRSTGPGRVEGPGGDRDMEYATVAVAQSTSGHRESDSHGVDASLTGAGKPQDDAIGSAGAVAGPGIGSSGSTQKAVSARDQMGLRTVVDHTAPQAKVRIPVRAELELRSASGRLATVGLNDGLLFRTLAKDLEALARLEPARAVPDGPENDAGHAPGEHRTPAAPALEATEPDRLRAWRENGAALPPEAQANGFQGAPEVREAVGRAMAAAHADSGFRKPGNAAHYAQGEALSTEWLLSALPLLVAAGAELPPVHVSGVEGQDIACSLHARLLDGRVLGLGDETTFETVVRSAPDGLRPSGTEYRHAAHHGRTGRFAGGEGPVRADYSGMNSVPAAFGQAGGPTDTAAVAAGTVPLHKPKAESALVQFTVQFRAVARVRHRHTQRLRGARQGVGVTDYVLRAPVVIRMPAAAARRMVADPRDGRHVTDAHGRLNPDPPPEGTAPA